MRSGFFSLVTALAACLLSFSNSAVAVAHATAHAHVAEDHQAAAPFANPTVEDGDHGHDHGHASIGTALSSRDGTRIDVAFPVIVPVVDRYFLLAAAVPMPGVPPALLPRPGPERGPPSGPRAPPTS